MPDNEQVRILCVDDEKNVLHALERFFMDDDYEILTASSGEEGLQILETHHPIQVVISDYRMPAMNGVDFLKEVYARWPETIRIVLSGYADAGAIVAAINEGHIYKFIPKPWNEEELRFTVNNSLERYHLQRQNRELIAALARYNEELEKKVQERTADLELHNRALSFAQNMLNALPVAVIGIDAGGMIVQGNQRAVDLFRDVKSGILGADCHEALPPEICRLIPELGSDGLVHQRWSYNGTEYEIRISSFSSFGEQGMVIVLIDEQQS